MSMQDRISDMLTKIRNGQTAKHKEVAVAYTKLLQEIAKVLKAEGYVNNYRLVKSGNHQNIMIELKYFEDQPVIKEIQRISRPGLRVYSEKKNLPKANGGLGIVVVSTPKGVMTDSNARKFGQGGELLCYVC